MALFQQPLINYSVPGLHYTRGSEASALVRAVVAQLSTHEYGLIVTKIVEGELCNSPPHVLTYALISHGVQFDTIEHSQMVSIHVGQLHAFSQLYSFSLTFDEEGDFWGFVSALSMAKMKAVSRISDLRDKFQQVLDTVAIVPGTPEADTPTIVDAAVAAEESSSIS